jgi:hypothetical protein
MVIHQTRTEANQREIIAKMDAWFEGMEACVGKLEEKSRKVGRRGGASRSP